jgi:hypothetical protein
MDHMTPQMLEERLIDFAVSIIGIIEIRRQETTLQTSWCGQALLRHQIMAKHKNRR